MSFGGGAQFGSEGSGFGASAGSSGGAAGFSFGSGDVVAPVFGAGPAKGATTTDTASPAPAAAATAAAADNGGAAAASPGGGAAGGADDEAVDDSQLILPDVQFGEVELTKGTEQEEVLVELRTKMYVFFVEDKYGDEVRRNMWKQRGLGNVQILKHKVTGAYRILMRQEGTLKITCNAPLKRGLGEGYAEIKPNGEKGMVTSLLIFNADENVSELKMVAFKFRSADMLTEFTDVWKSALENAPKPPVAAHLHQQLPQHLQPLERASRPPPLRLPLPPLPLLRQQVLPVQLPQQWPRGLSALSPQALE